MTGARSIVAARLGLVALVALAAAAVGWWRADRTRAWETPDWDARAFPRLDGAIDAAAATAGDLPIWVVAVQPACARCVAALARAHATREARRSPVRLVALVVDQPRRPSAAALAAIRADAIHWDRSGVWRHRWGHRVYGEALVFTPGGRYVRTIAPGGEIEEALPVANLGVPPDDL